MKLVNGICKNCGNGFSLRKGAKFCSMACRTIYNNSVYVSSITESDKKIINERAKKSAKRLKIERPEWHIFYRLRVRSKRSGVPFDLDIEDIVIPELCPLLNIPLKIYENGSSFDTPSVDRIDSNKGYVKGNVWIISYLANRMKQNATREQLKVFAKNVLIHF